MIVKRIDSPEEFLSICSGLKYKEKDNKEVEHITNGKLNNVYDLYKSMIHRWTEYYIIEHEDKVLCTIVLTYNNYLHYFVTVDLVPNITLSFVKIIKQLACETIQKRQVIFVRTSTWYKEAMKFNKLIGFRCSKINEDYEYSEWYMDQEGCK
jgi:hypothetical protein